MFGEVRFFSSRRSSSLSIEFQLIAVWLMHEHSKSSDEKLQLVELGPGRGTLMKDIVRVSSSMDENGKINENIC